MLEAVSDIYRRGVMADEASSKEENFSAADDIIFIQRDKRAVKTPASDVYTVSSALDKVISETPRIFRPKG